MMRDARGAPVGHVASALLDTFRMPWRFQRGHHARLTLTVVALATGVALVCAIDLVNRAVLGAFSEVVDTMAGRASLQITAGGDGLLREEIAVTVRDVDGVEVAVPVVAAGAFVADDSGEMLTVHAFDVTDRRAVEVYEARGGGLDAGDVLEFLNQRDSLLLTRAFAERRGLSVGGRIGLDTPNGRRDFTVRGLLEPTGVARVYGGSLAILDLFAGESHFTRPGFVSRVDVVVRRNADVDAVRSAIQAALPNGARVERPAQRKADLQRAMRSMHVLLEGVGLVALVTAFLIAFSRLSCVFEARTWQLGILRAVGMHSRDVRRELIKESLLLGAAGVALGLPAGLLLARLLVPAIAATTALNLKLVAPAAAVVPDPFSIALAAGLGLTAATLAATLPAWRAARVSALEAMSGRGVEVRDVGPRVLAGIRLLVAVALAVALAVQTVSRSPVWGIGATVLLVVATALATRPLLQRFSASAASRLLHLLGPTGRFAAAFARLNPRRTARAAAMLAVGVGAVVWLAVVAHSFETSVFDAMARGMRPDLVVSSVHVASGYLETPLDDSLLAELRRVPGVDIALAVRVRDWPFRGGDVALDAADPIYFVDGELGDWPLSAARDERVWQDVAAGVAVVVSSNFVLNLGLGVGDAIELDTPTGTLNLPIAGVTNDFASPRGTVKMSRALYVERWNDPQATRFFVRAAAGTDLHRLRDAIASVLGHTHALRILSARELHEYFRVQVRRAFAPLDVLAALILLVVLVGMGDTLAAGVLERRRDIGVMRALGAQRVHLRRLEIAEALIPGLLGLTLAAGCGLALGELWVRGTFPDLLGWVLESRVPWFRLGAIAAVTLAVCLLASILPGIQAARLDPGEMIRSE